MESGILVYNKDGNDVTRHNLSAFSRSLRTQCRTFLCCWCWFGAVETLKNETIKSRFHVYKFIANILNGFDLYEGQRTIVPFARECNLAKFFFTFLLLNSNTFSMGIFHFSTLFLFLFRQIFPNKSHDVAKLTLFYSYLIFKTFHKTKPINPRTGRRWQRIVLFC